MKIIPKPLQVKTLGLPRYVWLAIGVTMVAVVAYIRYRNSLDEVGGTEETDQTEAEMGEELVPGVEGQYLGADYSQYGYNDTGLRTLPAAGIVSGPPIVTEGPPPVQLDPTIITINANTDNRGGTKRKCTEGKPTTDPPKGFSWQCVNGHWKPVANVQKPNKKKPKPKAPTNQRCGKKPKRNPRKGYQWKCKGKRWEEVKVQKRKQARMFDMVMPSGNGPFRRDNHRIDYSPGNRDNRRLR